MERYNPYCPTTCAVESQSIDKPDRTAALISQISTHHQTDPTSSENKSNSEINETNQQIREESNTWRSVDPRSYSPSTSIQNDAMDTPSSNTYPKELLSTMDSLTIENPPREIPGKIVIANSIDISDHDDGITPTMISVKVVCAIEVISRIKEIDVQTPTNVNPVSAEAMDTIDARQQSVSTNHDDLQTDHNRDANMLLLVVTETPRGNQSHTVEFMPFGLQPSQTIWCKTMDQR